MTKYINTKVNLSEGQKEKFQRAYKANCSLVSILLNHDDLKGNDVLAITKTQAKKLDKAYKNGTGVTIRLSSKQLKHNSKVEGGFLGLLAGLAARALPMLAKTVLPALGVGALSGLDSKRVCKKLWDRVFTSRKVV